MRQPYSVEYKSVLDRCFGHLDEVVGVMETDGDYGPEWADKCRTFLEEIEDFVHYDEIVHIETEEN